MNCLKTDRVLINRIEVRRCNYVNKRIPLVCIFVLLMAFLSGCEAGGPGTITGTVIDGITGEPIEGVSVVYSNPLESGRHVFFEEYIYPYEIGSPEAEKLSQQYGEEIMRTMRRSAVRTSTDLRN